MRNPVATVLAALAAAAFAVPFAAAADPPAAVVPTVPVPFAGAPHNDDPNAGQFSVSFDDLGRFGGVGRPAEHYDSFPLGSSGQARSQARAGAQARPAGEKPAVDRLFVRFADQLRTISSPGK